MQSRVTSIKWPQWGLVVWLLGWRILLHEGRAGLVLLKSSAENCWQPPKQVGWKSTFFYLLSVHSFFPPFFFFFCKERSSKCQTFQGRRLSDNTVGWGMATVDGHGSHVTLLPNFPEAEAFLHMQSIRVDIEYVCIDTLTGTTGWVHLFFYPLVNTVT